MLIVMPKHSLRTIIRSGLRSPKLVVRFLKGKDPSGFDLFEIEKISGKPNLIVEAGAFNGVDTAKMARMWPDATIYAFEPIPELYLRAVNETKDYTQINLLPLALVNSDHSEVEINTFSANDEIHGSSSILPPTLHLEVAPEVVFDRAIVVPAIRLDNWYQQIEGQTVDLLWLDLQGAELEVLKSGLKCLANTRTLHIEVSLKPLYLGAPTFSEIDKFLGLAGFNLVESRIPVLSGNAIYKR